MAISVRSYHLDGYGHVNNARYLEFLEEARWAFFEQKGLSDLLQGIQMVVSRIDIRYRRSATEGDVLETDTRLTEILPRQIKFKQAIFFVQGGKAAVEAEVTLMSTQNGKAVSLPAPLREKLGYLFEGNV
ncbi:acyl-CoA thioesterase [Neisseria wadsworthii]|uniref:Thioesterase n=1 Tax=Neisseria wadsworthii 9715 TaxID=1030841 RepID=G4CMM8_9NEIS|nr:thioesterase family protein [Neisseria wadsworthii]EGZ51078.1 thioesterase [Neisseria wadsworthii 9715]QMT36353.1 acyl-CoA thioesterase [Neisseria wadsworthii]